MRISWLSDCSLLENAPSRFPQSHLGVENVLTDKIGCRLLALREMVMSVDGVRVLLPKEYVLLAALRA